MFSRLVQRSLWWGALVFGAGLLAAPVLANPAATKVDTNLIARDVTGSQVLPLTNDGQKATLFFFLMHDCPVANSYAPEINRIVEEYSKRQIRSFVVYVEGDLTPAAARQHVHDYGFRCRALLDPEQRLSKATGATISPEAVLLSITGELLYRGRIDDRVAGLGRRRVEPTRRDLRLTLDAFLNGKAIPARLTKAIGCYIPDITATKPSSP